MSERSPSQIRLNELPDAEQPIARGCAQLTAFVGRTLRGPVSTPVIVSSFSEFQQVFGGLWQPSPLSYAVEHFFEQGGRRAVIVRVVNGAIPATLSLRCGASVLYLEARAPGTREFLRASVDYDNLPPDDETSFNLVVQRVREPGSERVEAQETYRALSVDPGSPHFVAVALLESALVRVRGAVPPVRPDRTLLPGTNLPIGYVSSNPDGDDGRAISDYDLIGSAARGTGLFALEAVEDLSFVHLPPLSRATDIGVSSLFVAERFCRERRAILIVDPPAAWSSSADALEGLRALNFHSDNAVMFFPRIVTTDRLRGRPEVFGNGGAVAGVLSRIDESEQGVLPGSREPEVVLRGGVRLAQDVTAAERQRLIAHGINVLQASRSAERHRPLLRTLAGGANAAADWGYLSARRFALHVVSAIARGTRWAAFASSHPEVCARLQRQVEEFAARLQDAGAFADIDPATGEPAFHVICDETLNEQRTETGEVNLLIRFAAAHAGEQHGFMITQSQQGAAVRSVAISRLGAHLSLLRRAPTFDDFDTLSLEVPVLIDIESLPAKEAVN